MRTLVSLTRGAAAATGIAAALIASAAGPASAAIITRQSPGALVAPAGTFHDSLYGVAAASPSSAWAVGIYQSGSVKRNLIEHWNGRSWSAVANPSPGGTHGGFLNAVAAVSSSNAWAVGGYSNGSADKTLIEHWNGRSWKQVPSPSPGGGTHDSFLFGVAALSASSAWAVGGYVNGTAEQTLIEHWNGRSWKRVASPSPAGPARLNELENVTATSKSNAWAVGYYDLNGTSVARTLVEHWNGRSWKPVASPNPGGGGAINVLNGVAAASSTSAWAAGSYFNGFTDQPMLAHWNGKSWKGVAIPNPAGPAHLSSLDGVAAVSSSDAWAVGYYASSTAFRTLTLHWNGRSWKHVASPNPGPANNSYLRAAAPVSSRSVWAVGQYVNGSADLTLIEHWNGKTWRRVASPNQ